MTPEQVTLQQEYQQRTEACAKEIAVVLAKYNLGLGIQLINPPAPAPVPMKPSRAQVAAKKAKKSR